MTPEQAGEWIVTAVKKKPRAIMDMKTRVASGVYFCFPQRLRRFMDAAVFDLSHHNLLRKCEFNVFIKGCLIVDAPLLSLR